MLKRLYNRIYQDYLSKPVPNPALTVATDQQRMLIEELRAEIRKIPEAATEGINPAAKAWNEWMNNFCRLVLTNDPREFLTWNVIIGTMFTKSEPYIYYEFKYLNKLQDSKWQKAITESGFGQPARYYRFNNSSGNLVHHVYHLSQFEAKTGVPAETMDFVLEFGGGYGSMCRLFQNLGFKGKYVIFDLPAFSALQRYYLKSLGFDILNAESFRTSASGILCISDLEELRSILENYSPAHKKSMFVATWSFSETPVEFRKNIEPFLNELSYFLIAYQHQFREVNNRQYFKELAGKLPGTHWENFVISHMKIHDYLMGQPKT